MIYQTNYTPLVVFLIVVLGGAVGMGILIADTERVNPTNAQVRAEVTRLAVKQTVAVIDATETRQVAIARVTEIPVHQTAMHAAMRAQVDNALAQATLIALAAKQTEIAQQQNLNAQQAAAKATEIAVEVARVEEARTRAAVTETVALMLIAIVTITLTICVAYATVTLARAKERAAHAQEWIERRRAMELQVAVQARQERQTPDLQIVKRQPNETLSIPTGGNGDENAANRVRAN